MYLLTTVHNAIYHLGVAFTCSERLGYEVSSTQRKACEFLMLLAAPELTADETKAAYTDGVKWAQTLSLELDELLIERYAYALDQKLLAAFEILVC